MIHVSKWHECAQCGYDSTNGTVSRQSCMFDYTSWIGSLKDDMCFDLFILTR